MANLKPKDDTFQTKLTDYRGRLMELIPGEAVVAYTTVSGIAQSFPADRFWILVISTIALMALLPLYIWFAMHERNRVYIAVVTVSFLVWATNIDTPLAFWIEYKSWIGSIVLVLWTFAMPMLGPKASR